jgi:hypothetical protein
MLMMYPIDPKNVEKNPRKNMHSKLTWAFSHPNIPWLKFKSIFAFSNKIAPIENKKAIMIFYRIKCFNIPKRMTDLFNPK